MGTNATLSLLRARAEARAEVRRNRKLPSGGQPKHRDGTRFGLVASVAKEMGSRWTREQLAVRCWKAYPEVFGLVGYQEIHPDSNAVWICLWGKRGLLARGLVRRVEGSTFMFETVEAP